MSKHKEVSVPISTTNAPEVTLKVIVDGICKIDKLRVQQIKDRVFK